MAESETPEEREVDPGLGDASDPLEADASAEPDTASPSGPGVDEVSFEGIMDALRQAKVAELLLSTASTLASVAYGKLEAGDLSEAKAAIDAIGAILPQLAGQIDAGILRDFEQALANLRLAYVNAVAAGQ